MRKNVFFRALLTCIWVLSVLISFAQERTLTGTILDEKGVTLPGATVTVKNSKITTTTDASGKFSLKAPSGSKSLIVSFVGMQDQDVTIGSKSSYFISMKQGGVILGDVVVIGYGTRKRGDVNGAVSSVSSRDIADIPQPSVDQMLRPCAAHTIDPCAQGCLDYYKIPLGTGAGQLNFWANGNLAKQLGFFLQGQNGDVNEIMYFDEVAFVK